LFAMKHPLELVGVLLVAVMVRRFRSSVRARLAVALAR
jgi:hypothetical protein